MCNLNISEIEEQIKLEFFSEFKFSQIDNEMKFGYFVKVGGKVR